MDNGNIEENLLFTEALRLIINNYLFEIMIYLRMSYFTKDDIDNYVRDAEYVEPDGKRPRVIPFLLPGLPDPIKTMLNDLWVRAGGDPATAERDKIAPLLYTLVTTMKLINYRIDEVRKGYIGDKKDEREEEEDAFVTLFSGENPNMFSEDVMSYGGGGEKAGGTTTPAERAEKHAKRGRVDADASRRRREEEEKARRKIKREVGYAKRRAKANDIIKLALDSLSFVDPNMDDTGKQIMLQIVNVWGNVIQTDPRLLEILIYAYGNGPLLVQVPSLARPMNYYDILNEVFKNVLPKVNDPTMNMLHGIYQAMIYWKFGKLEGPNIVPTNNYYEQNRIIYELQLFAAVYYIELKNNMNARPVATPRSVTELPATAGGLGGITKKKRNLKKKKKSTKAKKKRKNNIKSKRKLKLIKKTIKVKKLNKNNKY